ncbi:MAG: 5-methylcytosine restriction system specificity protein McrC [Terriglobia bacterium]
MARQQMNRRRYPQATTLRHVEPGRDICLELQDYTTVRKPAAELFELHASADPQAQAARLADQFITQNRLLLDLLQVSVRRDYDGRDVLLEVESGSQVGAIPLISPVTAKSDFGLVVQPRFPWPGIGPMLAEMGWLVSPAPLHLPLLKRSERRVPPWVLSFMVLDRIKALLERLERRFEIVRETRPAPKGNVDWADYCTRQMSRAKFLSVPCNFPDLRDDGQLKGAIRYTLEKQLRSLETQREQGSFVHRLISFAESLLLRVRAVATRRPSTIEVGFWLRQPLRNEIFVEGLQAIEWTVEERGLAGLSDLEGIPWRMPMEQFFEAWVETVLRTVALRTGGILKAARRRQTVAALSWEPPYAGSQRSLIPDLVLELDGITLIVDAKYKRHWEELQEGSWHEQTADLREQHRQDLLQVLAYANLATQGRVVCCLVYPCHLKTWDSLEQRGRLFHQAELPNRGRRVQVWLTAVPMNSAVERFARPLAEQIRKMQLETAAT